MSTLFFAVLIPGIFRTPLNSSRILWMSCCLFILFFFSDAFFMRLLRSFSRCFSSLGVLLLSSMTLRISASLSRNSSLFCCCRCGPLCFFVVVLELARVAAGMEHKMLITKWALFRQSLSCPQVAAAAAAISCIDFVCIFFIFDSHKRVRALILQSLSCHPVTFTAFLSIMTSTGYRRPPVLTSMLELSFSTPLVLLLCCCASCFFFRSLVLQLQQVCFLLLLLLLRRSLFRIDLSRYFLCHVLHFLFWRRLFYCVNDFLIFFLELGHFNLVFFAFFVCSTYPIVSCFLFSLLAWVCFSGVLIKKVAMTHLWSLPM